MNMDTTIELFDPRLVLVWPIADRHPSIQELAPIISNAFPYPPSNVIIIKANVNHPVLDTFKVGQRLFSLVDDPYNFFVLAVETG